MKVKLKEDETIYEVFGIVILDNQEKLFLLYSNFEVLDTELEIIDGRIPFNWHWKAINEKWCKVSHRSKKINKKSYLCRLSLGRKRSNRIFEITI